MQGGMSFGDHIKIASIGTFCVVFSAFIGMVSFATFTGMNIQEARSFYGLSPGVAFWALILGFIVSLIGSYIAEDEVAYSEVD